MYKRNQQSWLKNIDFILLDVLALQVSLALAYFMRHGGLPYATELYRSLAVLYAAIDILVTLAFNTMNNVLKRGLWLEFSQSVKHVAIVLGIMAVYMFSMQSGDQISRAVVFLTAALHLMLGYATRVAWKPVAQSITSRRDKASMVVVADERRIAEMLGRIGPRDEFRVTGIVLTNRDATGESISGVPVVASISTAADYICREWVDEVFFYPEDLEDIELHEGEWEEDIEELEATSMDMLIRQCEQMAVPIHIQLPLSGLRGKCFSENIAGYEVLTEASNYASPLQLFLKRILDIVGGLVGSAIALVIMVIIGPIIKRESPGPILFRQTRIGQNGRRFQIYKIRSMYLDAEERKVELFKDNRVSDGLMFKLDWDPRIIGNKMVDGKRITGIGEFVRSTSLDEFPQFFNVLLGQMSLVGTRPPTVDEWEKYRYHHRARLATKPGITGMWQVSGRSEITDFEEVVRLDTNYINNWSMGLDLKILWKTVGVVLKRAGAM